MIVPQPAATAPRPEGTSRRALPWGLWARQALLICRFEIRKSVAGWRTLPIYLLAAVPVALFSMFLLISIVFSPREMLDQGPGFATVLFEAIFQSLILRCVVFFGCVVVFMNLFRGEILDRSLHYSFLAPIRREVLVAGKFLSGVVTTVLVFGASTALSFFLLYMPYGRAAVRDQFLHGSALPHLLVYLIVVTLGCIGYGALFLLMGLLFRNPVVPAVVILVWESIIFLLPPLLKKFSVIYYLQSLCPVRLSGGPIEILAEPSPPSIAIP